MVVIRQSSDWIEIAVEGKTFFEGHSVPLIVWCDLLRKLRVGVERIEVPEGDDFDG